MEMLKPKMAKLGVLVFLFGAFAGYDPQMAAQYTDMDAADLVMLGLALVFGRDTVQKFLAK